MAVAVRVIPCLDVDAGRVVKGINFEGLRDAGDPVELAHRYDNGGADELTFLDVTASHVRRVFDSEQIAFQRSLTRVPKKIREWLTAEATEIERWRAAGVFGAAASAPRER